MAAEEFRFDRHEAVVGPPKLQEDLLLGRIEAAARRFGRRLAGCCFHW